MKARQETYHISERAVPSSFQRRRPRKQFIARAEIGLPMFDAYAQLRGIERDMLFEWMVVNDVGKFTAQYLRSDFGMFRDVSHQSDELCYPGRSVFLRCGAQEFASFEHFRSGVHACGCLLAKAVIPRVQMIDPCFHSEDVHSLFGSRERRLPPIVVLMNHFHAGPLLRSEERRVG